MRLSAPKLIIWLLSLVLVLLGVTGHFVAAGVLTTISFWLVLAGFVILAAGTLFRGV